MINLMPPHGQAVVASCLVKHQYRYVDVKVFFKDVKVIQLCFDSLRSHGLQRARLLCPWNSPGHNTGVVVIPISKGSSNPEIEPRSPALQADSSLSEPPGKPKNTGVGSLSLLQGIFLTQGLNWGLLHCRQILYQLSYQGSSFLDVINI